MSKNPDDPEDWDDYVARVIAPKMPNSLSFSRKRVFAEEYRSEWERLEEQKRRNRVSRKDVEAEEHAKTVERLKIEIERQKERIRRDELKRREREQRDAQRKADQEAKEAERKAEKEAEQERRDPTPVFLREPPLIPDEIRSKHIYVPGGTQRGKSTQLHSIIYNDIMQGNGVGVLDPKRDLLRLIVHSLPEYRVVDGERRRIIDDVVYLDLKTPVPLNFLDRDPEETERVVNDLIYVVTKGDETLKAASPLLEKIIRAFLLIPDTTITDMYRFIAFKSWRDDFLLKLSLVEKELVEMWKPFPKEGVATLERRLSAFYNSPFLKAIFDARTPPLDLASIMDQKKILLVDLSPPRDKNAQFYGSLLMAQIASVINRRSAIPKYKRTPFFLHVDEFELCQTESFADLLSVAGGLGLRLTLGNQYLDQVLSTNLKAILGNNPTYIFSKSAKTMPINLVTSSHHISPRALCNLNHFKLASKLAPPHRYSHEQSASTSCQKMMRTMLT
jgi:hypothetical protein